MAPAEVGLVGLELQRDFAIQPRVPGPIDHAERAGANRLQQAKVGPFERRLAVGCEPRRGVARDVAPDW